MALFFAKVPREIRDKVYKLLLANGAPDIQLDAIGAPWWRETDLHPAILRTCKQAYAEGLPVLYEQNAFCYTSRTGKDDTVVIRDSLKDKIGKIKHFKLRLIPYTVVGVGSALNMPLVITRFLAAAGCSLHTFHLSLFYCTEYYEALEHFSDKDLHQAVAALAVQCKITISIDAHRDDKRWRENLGYMVNCVGLIKQWAITEKHSSSVPKLDPRYFVAVLPNYDRNWILEPANASTIDKVPVPSSTGIDDLYRRLMISE